jgi:type I restriction enzyme R subunit
MLELYEVCAGMFYGFNYSKFKTGSPKERTAIVPPAAEHVLKHENGKDRFMKAVTQLSKAFALSVPHERAIAIRDDLGFFQTVRAVLAKTTPGSTRPEEELDAAIRQIVSRAVASDQVIDIFSAAGMKSPDISILSDEFLAEVKELPHKNLAFEVLKKLLSDEVKARQKKNLVQSRLFSQMLGETIRKYQNRSIETAQVIQELIDLAKDMREAARRGEKLGFTDEELAFYDALEVNDSAVKVLGDETLKTIARELVETVHQNVTIDWTVKESVRAKLRTMVKRILRKYGYPPDKQEKATQTVLEQAELLCRDWAV